MQPGTAGTAVRLIVDPGRVGVVTGQTMFWHSHRR